MLRRVSIALLFLAACASPRPRPAPGAQAPGAGEPNRPRVRLPDTAVPTRYALELTIDPSAPQFAGAIAIELEVRRPTRTLWLNARGLRVGDASVRVGGAELAATVLPPADDVVGFRLPRPLPVGAATLRVAFEGTMDDDRTEGIYRVKESDGRWYAYTMFEPVMARRAFPCFDEPGYKVPWTLAFRVPAGQLAVANTATATTEPAGDGWVRIATEPSWPMPSYLVAFMVGPFDLVDAGTAGNHATPLRFIVPRGRGGAELGYAREVTPRIVRLLEDYTGIAYPFRKLDVAVVPRFWGTMEHPGIVALGQELTLIAATEDSLERRQAYANIAIHELAHYWFGDYVTTAWWDDIWLNEGLGTWLDQKITHQLEPAWGWDRVALSGTHGAMNADELSSAKRVREPTDTLQAVAGSFDANITYYKGAAIATMFEAWLGPNAFREAIHGYLERHAWGSATSADFYAAIDAARPGVGAAFASFVEQRGMPLVSVALDCGAARPRVDLTQERYAPTSHSPDPAPRWHIPVCVRYAVGDREHRQCTLLTEPAATLELAAATACPAWLFANAGATGYYRVRYTKPVLASLLAVEARALTPLERLSNLANLNALVESGDLPLSEALSLTPGLARDPDPAIASRAAGLVSWAHSLAPERTRAPYARALRAMFERRAQALGWQPRDGESPETRSLRWRLLGLLGTHGEVAAIREHARALAERYLRDPAAVTEDVAALALGIAAFAGDAALFDTILARARAETDHRRRGFLLTMLGQFTDPVLIQRALGLVLDQSFDQRDAAPILVGALGRDETRESAIAFLRDHFDEIAPRMTLIYAADTLFTAPAELCDAKQLDALVAFLAPKVPDYPGSERPLANATERARRCIAVKATQQSDAIGFLEQFGPPD